MHCALIERIRTQLGTAAFILLQIVISVLVVITVIMAFHTIADISRQIGHQRHPIFVGALIAGFVPFGWIVFWGAKALGAQFHEVFGALQKNSDHRE